jgi:hypothetical protein
VTTLIGVYHDTGHAESAARALHDEVGLPDDALVLGDARDAEREVAAEMEAEVAEGWGSPGLGAFLTAEQMRGAFLFAITFGAIGAVLLAPIGVLLFTDSWSTVTRLLLGALVGALFGSTVGALLGGGFAMQSTDQPLAAEAGVTLRVEAADDERCAEIMSHYEPIRIDRWGDGQRTETLVTEGSSGVQETVENFVRNAAEPRHRD